MRTYSLEVATTLKIRHYKRMNKDIKKFLDFPTESSAQIINRKEVEVTAPDGEEFTAYCQMGVLLTEENCNYELN